MSCLDFGLKQEANKGNSKSLHICTLWGKQGNDCKRAEMCHPPTPSEKRCHSKTKNSWCFLPREPQRYIADINLNDLCFPDHLIFGGKAAITPCSHVEVHVRQPEQRADLPLLYLPQPTLFRAKHVRGICSCWQWLCLGFLSSPQPSPQPSPAACSGFLCLTCTFGLLPRRFWTVSKVTILTV